VEKKYSPLVHMAIRSSCSECECTGTSCLCCHPASAVEGVGMEGRVRAIKTT
jgi:hypothetical protein